MDLDVPCPYCETVVTVPTDYLGGGVRCPSCSQVIAVQQTGFSTDEPIGPAHALAGTSSVRIRVKERTLRKERRYEPGRGPLLLALGLSSIGVSVVGLVAGMFLCGSSVLFAPLALGLALPAWIMGQRDMEKIRLTLMDPYAEPLTRLGWVSGIVGTILGVLLLVCGLGGLYLLLIAVSGAGKGGV